MVSILKIFTTDIKGRRTWCYGVDLALAVVFPTRRVS